VPCGVSASAVFTAAAGYALASWLPQAALQLTIGTLLLIFGLQWLRKAILRSSGRKALHDEAAAFEEQTGAARAAESQHHLGLDWFGFVVSFKGVFLEGVEVVFIVLTFGLNADNMPVAVTGAAIGALLVLALGAAIRTPLSRVPENTLTYGVGLLLATFRHVLGHRGPRHPGGRRREPELTRRRRRRRRRPGTRPARPTAPPDTRPERAEEPWPRTGRPDDGAEPHPGRGAAPGRPAAGGRLRAAADGARAP
jgi:uncharacterized membrane protein YfcA